MMRTTVLSSFAGPVRLLARPVVTLHFEDDSIRLLVVKGSRVVDWGVEPLEPGLVSSGVVGDQEAVGEHVRSLLSSHRLTNGKLVVSVTGHRSLPRILHVPEMGRSLLAEAIPREMKREMPIPLEELYLSWQVIGRENGRLRVFALCVPRDVLDPLVQAIKLSGRSADSMDIKRLCLVRAVGRRNALIADLEPGSVDAIVVRDAIPATVRTISLGAQAGGIESKVQQLGEELARTVKFYTDTHPDEPLEPSTPVCLTGSLAEEVASSGVVETSVGYRVEALAPVLECPPDLPIPKFMVNIGLALKET